MRNEKTEEAGGAPMSIAKNMADFFGRRSLEERRREERSREGGERRGGADRRTGTERRKRLMRLAAELADGGD